MRVFLRGLCWLALAAVAVGPAHAAIRLRPSRRRLCALHRAVRRPRGLRRALRPRCPLPRLGLLLSGNGGERRQQERHLLAEEPGEAARGEPVLRERRQGRRRSTSCVPARSRTPSTARAATIAISIYRKTRTSRPASRPARTRIAAAPGPMSRPGYLGTSARCYLKDEIKPPRRRPCCMSGVVR